MDVLNESLWDLIEKQKITIDVLFSYIENKDKISALADVAERIRTEFTKIELGDHKYE